MIIGMLILGFILAIPVGIILVCMATAARAGFKKEARAVLSGDKMVSKERLKRIMSVLSTIPNDLEAADLWHKLQELR